MRGLSFVLRANLIGHKKASTRDRVVPHVVFIDPQRGQAGITEREPLLAEGLNGLFGTLDT